MTELRTFLVIGDLIIFLDFSPSLWDILRSRNFRTQDFLRIFIPGIPRDENCSREIIYLKKLRWFCNVVNEVCLYFSWVLNFPASLNILSFRVYFSKKVVALRFLIWFERWMMCFAVFEKSSCPKSQLNPFLKSLLSATSNPSSNLLYFLEHDQKHGNMSMMTN